MRSVLFSNEMLGFGHLRISLALAQALAARGPQSTALVVTGFPGYTRPRLPPGVDTLKLPAAPVSADPRWGATAVQAPARLAIAPERLLALRGEIALAAVRELAPQIIVCDHLPLGQGGELRPMLEWVRSNTDCLVALAVRDFDDQDEVASYWYEELVEDVRRLFDLALVYNPGELSDVRVRALEAAGLPVHRTALLGMSIDGHAPPNGGGPAGPGDAYLLVTGGGGIDGYPLLRTTVESLRLDPLPIPAVMITGPLMPDQQVTALREAAAGLAVRIEKYRADLPELLAGAAAVVSMAGYATVAEILGSGTPALLVPRTSPRSEQLYRARYWAEKGRVQVLESDALGPASLRDAITTLLGQRRNGREPLTGAAEAAEILERAASARTQEAR